MTTPKSCGYRLRCGFARAPLWTLEIASRFGRAVEEASRGGLAAWAATAPGALARIILVDQFRRNILRDSSAAFGADALARQWALDGLAPGGSTSNCVRSNVRSSIFRWTKPRTVACRRAA
ncbi:DUF924 family protein [Algiphilus sp. W345]|uniref:DUF924 family protein n=1 Tax=Banduia mediterranea TaxID=3075609 RepID=A0ABU2WI81_9GAMM|nr:DUF924 family protein [Algiphilus sp. W345]MDT0497583.1 DUF924 family protein [Algiphilus sp. W345]